MEEIFIMDMKAFCEKVKAALTEHTEEGMQVRISEVRKNNGIVLHGVSVFRPGINITPTVYLEQFLERYEDGETFADIMRQIETVLDENRLDESFDVSIFTDFKKARERIVYKLVNVQRNGEILEDVPYMPYLDMAVVFYYLLDEQQTDGYATILIRNTHMKYWGITTEELYEIAASNTVKLLPPKICNMEDMMRQILAGGISELQSKKNPWDPEWPEKLSIDELISQVIGEDQQVPMYVLTNRSHYYGAAGILYPELLKCIGERLESNFFVLPSSVHELILLRDLGVEDAATLMDMVKEVNRTEVKAEEVLSDSVYYYDREKETLCILRREAYAVQ